MLAVLMVTIVSINYAKHPRLLTTVYNTVGQGSSDYANVIASSANSKAIVFFDRSYYLLERPLEKVDDACYVSTSIDLF